LRILTSKLKGVKKLTKNPKKLALAKSLQTSSFACKTSKNLQSGSTGLKTNLFLFSMKLYVQFQTVNK